MAIHSANRITKNQKKLAGLFCILYILIQIFQEYVYRTIPVPTTTTEELLQGATALHKWRSFLLLLSFFPMLYIFIVLIIEHFKKHPLYYTLASLGLLLFCLLEIGLRSVEFFYIQSQLPQDYLAAIEPTKENIIQTYTIFQSVQMALYFPLMLAQAIASIILALTFETRPKLNYLIKIAFAINAFRLLGRILAMLFHINWFDSFSGSLYLPFVVVIFGLLGIWFFKSPVNSE